MKKFIKLGVVAMGLFVFAFSVQAQVQDQAQEQAKTYISNFDIAKNAGIAYEKLNLIDKISKEDIKSNAIGSSEIKDRSIKGEDIKKGAIGSKQIKSGAIKTSELADNSVTSDKIADGAFTTDDIADGSITNDKIAADAVESDNIATGAVTTDEILDGTIAGGDLAADIAITTTGMVNLNGGIAVDTSNFTVSGTTGDVATAGDLDVNGNDIDSSGSMDITGATGMNINTGAGDITLDPAGNDVLPGSDSTDNLGADATRWSTIYADTLNYSTAITDANTGNTTVDIGDSNTLDTVNITAKTAISSEHWSVTEPGAATFVSVDGPVGSVTPATGTFTTLVGDTVQTDTAVNFATNGDSINNATDDTFVFNREDSGTVTITSSDDNTNADLTVTAGGTGSMILGSASVSSVTISTDGTGNSEVVLPAESIEGNEIADETITSDNIDDGTIAGGDLASDISITTSGNITATGTVDFSGADLVIDSGTSAPGTCTVGQMFIDTDASSGANLLLCLTTDNWTAVYTAP